MTDHFVEVPKKVLSPAAQAVLDAFSNASDGEYIDGVWVVNERTMLSAALCAVADQVASPIPDDCRYDVFNRQLDIRAAILAIAGELENGQ